MAVLCFRVLFVDLFGYVLPLTQLNLIAYIPRASNLFGIVAIAYLSAALHLEKKV